MDRNKEFQYITEDEVWERFVIVRRIWMKYNGREPPKEDMDGERRKG